ncbi:uncharacterized protein L203_101208 [Cryptococcus depauperatus CBS 7841]|uniref:LCCL domain-containing protein n=1 Tax=Cryptococcus depauperatus CBS 7841 TaxID=1295531 RepID=A0AAJ8LXJ8_9TREE
MIVPYLRAFYRLAYKFIIFILGPRKPTLPLERVLPQASCSASITLSTHSKSGPIDATFIRLSLPKALYPFLAVWVTANVLLTRQQYYLHDTPSIVQCTSSPWEDWPPDSCGISGTLCEQDLNRLEGSSLRCMGCSDIQLGNPRWIGGQKINHQPVIVGGGDKDRTYRADSWLCPSAIHSGLISSQMGGCVTFHALPFPSLFSPFVNSSANKLTSQGFTPSFPGAFRLLKEDASGCLDLHWIMTAFNSTCLAITTLFLRPPPALLFSLLFFLGFFQISLFSNPPSYPPDWEQLLSRFLPSSLIAYWIYKQSFCITLPAFRKLPFEVTILQGASYWLGVESSTMFANFPITRLGYDPLDPAGIIALICVIIIVIGVVGIQWWEFRRLALVQYYLIRYLPLIPIFIVLSFIPDYSLRPHHYMLALLAIPLLSLPNRVSLCLQAFMLGLYLDGVCRWGYASILESNESLLGDADSGSWVPEFWQNSSTSTMLYWSGIGNDLKSANVSEYSILLNDIQVSGNYTQTYINISSLDIDLHKDNYFRIAYMANGSSLDFSNPITRWKNGTWNWVEAGFSSDNGTIS